MLTFLMYTKRIKGPQMRTLLVNLSAQPRRQLCILVPSSRWVISPPYPRNRRSAAFFHDYDRQQQHQLKRPTTATALVTTPHHTTPGIVNTEAGKRQSFHQLFINIENFLHKHIKNALYYYGVLLSSFQPRYRRVPPSKRAAYVTVYGVGHGKKMPCAFHIFTRERTKSYRRSVRSPGVPDPGGVINLKHFS